MAVKPDIPIETLRQLLAYDPQTGKLKWLERPRDLCVDERAWKIWNTKYTGTDALTARCREALHGNIFGRKAYAHRVAYALYHGEWPVGVIDHINGNPLDNRIVNLRDVSQRTNMRNQKERNTNTSGVTGVVRFKRNGKWRAQITAEGKCKFLGYFVDFDDAVAARKSAEARLDFHSNHGRAR